MARPRTPLPHKIQERYENLAGKQIGWLKVIAYYGRKDKNTNIHWFCECRCGNKSAIMGHKMLTSKTERVKTCGCRQNTFLNMEGKRYGKLLCLEFVDFSSGNQAIWRFRCDCGVEKVMLGGKVSRKDGTKSCGCGEHKSFKETKGKLSHLSKGQKKQRHRLQSTWGAMKKRCYNKNDSNYHHYGGRGIKVCDGWLHDFEAFYIWALSNGYGNTLSIDRIDVNGNYEPTNCRWATQQEQCNNRRNVPKHDVFGISLTCSEASRKYGLTTSILQHRLKKGYSLQEAIVNVLDKEIRQNLETMFGVCQ